MESLTIRTSGEVQATVFFHRDGYLSMYNFDHSKEVRATRADWNR